MTVRNRIALLMLISSWVAFPAAAQAPAAKADEHSGHHAAIAPEADMVEGEVRKVDKEAGKITLKHGPIPNLEMTGMTMVFRVKDPAMLDAVKAGDKVRFKADKVQGALTVTEIKSLP
jgi:Cu(I)/Ag(I) efflux system protein CusF